jgi:hypothetical protein
MAIWRIAFLVPPGFSQCLVREGGTDGRAREPVTLAIIFSFIGDVLSDDISIEQLDCCV